MTKLVHHEMVINSKFLEVPRSYYQRHLNANRVKRIAAEFDERIANAPKVSYRDGHYYVFDGQHPAAHVLYSLLRERNQPEGYSGNHGSCGYFHHNGCIRRSDPREKERIHDLSAKRIACAIRHGFKITEMFLSAGQ